MSKTIRSVIGVLTFGLIGLSMSSAAQAANYQQYLNGTCPGLTCSIDFPVVPAGKTLEITNFSCYLRVSNNADVYALQLLQIKTNASIGIAVTADLQFVDNVAVPASFESVYQSNDTIFAFATAGQRFRAQAWLTAGSHKQFACHISGQLLP